MAILSLPSLPSWRTTLFLVYLLLNLKSLPFSWHIRLLWNFFPNVSRIPIPPKPIKSLSSSSLSQRRILSHPLFTPVQVITHTPILETDYNLHKSNSTYFADLDVSRTKLMSRIYSPAWRKVNAQLDSEGYKGKITIALGATHLNFKREIAAYGRIAVRSRLIGWDGKWFVILSQFIRPSKGKKREELCAVGLSKYVIKKGRFTVKPERALSLGGWLPKNKRTDEEDTASPSPDNGNSGAKNEGSGNIGLKSTQAPEVAEKVILTKGGLAAAADALGKKEKAGMSWDPEAWSWEEVEEERLRGLELAKGWLALDAELYGEFDGE